ncbi:MAG: glycosyltransferase [Roseburia sp.]|nr:glycosyltransferase [Roseburia sp.]
MNKSDLISVIVPVYNMEQYLERCINSIKKQSYSNLEIILVDDGSTDHSADMCDTYAQEDQRIKVIHKVNGGLSDARNAGLAIATGAYIGYVDSDDWIEPQMYQKMYEACIENEAQVAVCRYAKVYSDETIRGGNHKTTVFERDSILKVYLSDNSDYIVYNSVWSKLFAREIIVGEIFPVGKNSEDIMYTTRAFCKVTKTVYLDECLYNYVLDREGSIMNVNRTERMFQDEIPFWREHIAYIRQHVSDEMGDMAAYYFYRRMLSYYMELSQQVETRNAAKQIASMMKNEKADILKVYGNAYEGKGDVVRMNIFMMSPTAYKIMNKLYEKVIIHLRKK